MSFLRRVASVAERAARPVPNRITVTGSGIGTGRGVGVGTTGVSVAVGGTEVAVGGTDVGVGGSGVGVSAATESWAKTAVDMTTGENTANINKTMARTILKCDLR